MRKLQLKSDLTSIYLFWELNLKFQKNQIDTNQFFEIDKWRQKLLDFEKMYHNPHYRLGGFTEFDDQIKTLKKDMKAKLWKSTQNSIIFLKSYPISIRDEPFILNLIRKKNAFRKTFE